MTTKKSLVTFTQRKRIMNSGKKKAGSDDANKFTFEVAKHITTLDTGIIVLFGSLNLNWVKSQGIASSIDSVLLTLGIATIAAFLFSIIFCVAVMFLIPYQLNDDEEFTLPQSRLVNWSLVFGLAFFTGGILLIIVISGINLIFQG